MWSQEFSINGKKIGIGHPTFIIAEAGVNHNGDIHLARKLIDVAARSGADAVKFQTFKSEKVATFQAKKAEYQETTTRSDESQLEMIKKLELPFSSFRELQEYSRSKGLIFLSTPFDLESLDFLAELDVPAFKISSGELINPLLLKKAVDYRKPIILSAGMATLGEIETALDLISQRGENRLALLHCITSYPAPIEIANLRAIQTLRNAFRTIVGYSDHTLGTTAMIVAVTLGAKVIEKHFTLDKSLPGPDHKASADPEELDRMIKEIRRTEASLGDGIKIPSQAELDIAKIARRSIVASRDLKKGEFITEDAIELKRPAEGLAPKYLDLIMGKKLNQDVKADSFIIFRMIEWDN
ncbi:MAG: N-acetylneuraminate synthase [Candidatus Odinarchaeota archaeon]